MTPITIRLVSPNDLPEWLRMRVLLWPHHTEQEMLDEMRGFLALLDESPVFIAVDGNQKPCGFLEGGTRKYADGCETSPVGYIEGWFVDVVFREKGVGGLLVKAFETWCRQKGLSEIASDTWEDNLTSITAHKKLGYTEIERLVHFARKLT